MPTESEDFSVSQEDRDESIHKILFFIREIKLDEVW
jgi:hypothetical protein